MKRSNEIDDSLQAIGITKVKQKSTLALAAETPLSMKSSG